MAISIRRKDEFDVLYGTEVFTYAFKLGAKFGFEIQE